jgi:hypothetical protein
MHKLFNFSFRHTDGADYTADVELEIGDDTKECIAIKNVVVYDNKYTMREDIGLSDDQILKEYEMDLHLQDIMSIEKGMWD